MIIFGKINGRLLFKSGRCFFRYKRFSVHRIPMILSLRTLQSITKRTRKTRRELVGSGRECTPILISLE